MPTTVKILSLDDLDVLDRVDPDVFDRPVQRDLAALYLADPRAVLAVAIEDDVVVGMASGLTYVHPDKPLQLWVNEVGVAERCHRRGLGRRLVQTLLDHGRTLGCVEAWVATEVDNRPARALYAAVGGVEDDAAAVVYTWPLTPGGTT